MRNTGWLPPKAPLSVVVVVVVVLLLLLLSLGAVDVGAAPFAM